MHRADAPTVRVSFHPFLLSLNPHGRNQQARTLIQPSHRTRLHLPPETFTKFFENPQHKKLKLVKYPSPHANDPIPSSGIQGFGPHKDGSFLTFLLQATPHSGLEIQNKNAEWIPADPVPRTRVINIGRSLKLSRSLHRHHTRRCPFSIQLCGPRRHGTPLGPRYSLPVFRA
jgi:hypothetical protein